MGPAANERWLLPLIAAVAAIVTGAVLTFRPFPLPGWLPGASGWDAATLAQPGMGSLPQRFIVTPGDGQITVSWPSSEGATHYRAEAVSETEAVFRPAICRSVASSVPLTSSCVIAGLDNGFRYLVTVTVNSEGESGPAAPVRTLRVIPQPALLSSADLVLWLDPSDYPRLQTTQPVGPARVGSGVVVVHDKSRTHDDADQPQDGLMPKLGQMAELPALLMDGTTYLRLSDLPLPVGNHPATVVVVAAQDDPSPKLSCYHNLISWGAPGTGRARIIYKGCKSALAFAETYNTAAKQAPTQEWPDGQAAVVSAIFSSTGTMVRLNGSASYRWVAPADTRMDTVGRRAVYLGGVSWDAQGGWVGRIGDVMMFNRALSPPELRVVERYLALKWQFLLGFS